MKLRKKQITKNLRKWLRTQKGRKKAEIITNVNDRNEM